MKIDYQYDGTGVMLCPYCACEYVHPTRVRVEPVCGEICVDACEDGVAITKSDAAKHSRGVSIKVRFLCENLCYWESSIAFRKGITTIVNTRLPDPPEDGPAPSTLWRD